ncbi:hypothetical protein [Ligilactobacillus murinus]|uniref:hypothetical protein n=1 Tax=Ligilactobacillus murinus TaxID=1622 RepID=UPI001431A472|nr:hypothetical protein [Ligilactobacillus murinus]MBF0759168.1 hypothetical protein [Ligilactobacillus murinus]MBF0831397.1 hypothetical protein [Ligilactobacillus murinus]
MKDLKMFDVMSEEELTDTLGGYNRLAAQIGHYTGKAAIVGVAAIGVAALL